MTDTIPSPTTLGLPVDEWRPQQVRAVESILTAFDAGKRFFFLNGATGVGKSIIAAAVGRVMGARSTFLTHTIQLQEQYLRTMPDAATATGKANHVCLAAQEAGLLEANAEDCEKCEHAEPGGCGYYDQFFRADVAPEVVLNYAYGARVFQGYHFKALHEEGCKGCNPFANGRSLLVCDEGDLAEQAVVEAVKLEAFRPSFSSEGVQLPRHSNLMQWAAWADDISGVVEAKAAEARDSYMANKNKESLSRLRRMRRIMQFVGGAKDLDGADDVGTVFRHTDKGVEIRPLWGWHDAKRVLFKRFEHVIIMSATLGDPELLARKLGIEEGEYEVLDLPSPFDLEHRRVWRWPVAKVSARSSEDDYRKLFQAADYIIGRFPQRKGIVHAASHKLAQLFYAESGQQERLLVHGSADKMDVLNTFKTSLQPNVLVTASFTTGLDLPGMLGFQVILKVPFGNLGDDVTRMRKEWGDDGDKFGARNYRAEAMNTVIQAAGRGVRTPTDVCHTFILDANFNMLTRGTYMPQSFDDALTWLDKGAMPSGLGNAS